MAISNASNQIVKVNLIPGIVPSVLHLSQYDTGAGRPVTFSVYDGSQAFTIPSGISIAFEGTKPDGNGFSFTCSKSGSNALLTNYTNQMTALPGKIMCQLVFTDTSGGRVGSLPVLMVVTPAGINGDTVISDSDIEAIVAAQNLYAVLNAKLDTAIDQMNTTAANAKASETAAKASETNAASSATEAQGYADSALTAATNAAGYAGEAEYRLMINPETGHMALAHYTKGANDAKSALESAINDLRDSVAARAQTKTTVFNSDGSITETLADGRKKNTVFNADGSITETLSKADGTVIWTNKTVFNADGSITEAKEA